MSNRRRASAALKLAPPPKPTTPPKLVRLDLGVGNGERKKAAHPQDHADWIGVDLYKRDGVDVGCDLSKPGWPWKSGTVDEVFCSHTLEHIPAMARITFFNELWRILKLGGKATIITPHWASNRAYGDVTHAWPPVSEMFWFSLDPVWRRANQPHLSEGSGSPGTEFRCDFHAAWGYQLAPWLTGRTQEYINNAMQQYKEAAQDMICTLIKRDGSGKDAAPTAPPSAVVPPPK